MKKEKKKYTTSELKEFEALIHSKLENATAELNYIKESLGRKNDSGTDSTASTIKILEDGADTMEKENLNIHLIHGEWNLMSKISLFSIFPIFPFYTLFSERTLPG